MDENDTRKLFVAGLSDTVTEGILRQLFENAGGSVVECAVPRDRQTGRGRGFGFVTLSTDAEANQVREALDGSLHEGRPISVRAFRGNRTARPSVGPSPGYGGGAPSRDREDRENTLFMAGLPGDCTDAEVLQVFEDAGVGPVLKLHLPVDPEGRRRGFGFASLENADAAKEAVPKLREHALRGRPLTVDVARPRGERPATGGPAERTGGERPGGWTGRPPPSRGGGFSGPSGAGGPPARSFDSGGGGAPAERQTWDERRGGPGGGGRRPTSTAGGGGGGGNKKKKERGGGGDRSRNRRDSEGFRAPRSRGYMDWDDD